MNCAVTCNSLVTNNTIGRKMDGWTDEFMAILSYACVLMCVCTPGGALIDIGESMKRMAEVKDSLDIDVKQNFIDPLQAVADKDIKDIQVKSKSVQEGN